MDFVTIVLATAAVAGLYMAWNIGANDVANAMGTSVGSGALSVRHALIVAGVFELAGALLLGGRVTRTIGGGIVTPEVLGDEPIVVAIGMTACLIAAGLWLQFATSRGWPVSTTHAIVGAVLGFGLWSGGGAGVHWWVVLRIAASWILSPALGAALGFGIFTWIQRRLLHTADLGEPGAGRPAVFALAPVFAFVLVGATAGWLMTERMGWTWGVPTGAGSGVVAFAAMRAGMRKARQSGNVEHAFIAPQVLTACFVAFAHGSNDVANAVGPLAATFGAMSEGVREVVHVPFNVLLIGAFGIVLGLATYGYKVMATIGRSITALTPSRGFSAELATASTILLASRLGLPVSTTHTLVGAVIGVGLARSIGAVDLSVVRRIVVSWVFTLPVTCLLAMGIVAAIASFL